LLPSKTEEVWNFLKTQPLLGGFVLIGGSALALRLRHRISEDLDFAWIGLTLPRRSLEQLVGLASRAGLNMQRKDDEAAVGEFVQGGLDLHDYQQDFVVNEAVKVSFFAADTPLEQVLREPAEPTARVATLPELFKAKALVSARRSKTRDWLDLYILLRDHGFTLHDYQDAFRQGGIDSQFETGLTRLCSGTAQRDDEGYRDLLPNLPTIAEMADYFRDLRDRFEIETAADARRKERPG
jgi:nucleotidyltransferase AbiEii toxin of type IV toxin-antitoxin system